MLATSHTPTLGRRPLTVPARVRPECIGGRENERQGME